MMKNKIILKTNNATSFGFIFCLFLFLSIGGCVKQEDFKYIPGNPGGKLNETAWEFLENKDSFSIMKNAVDITGLKNLYADPAKHTFIIPTNEAFREYLKENSYASISAVPIPILKNILLYHVAIKEALFTDTTFSQSGNPITFLTENGQKMYLSRNNNYQGVINEGTDRSWVIQTSNLEPTNGAIHISPSIVYFSAKTAPSSKPNNTTYSDTIYVVQDAYVNGGSQSAKNFGSNDLIKVKNVDGSGDYDRKTYLMFNLDNLTKSGNLRTASVEVGVKFTHGKGLRLSLYDVPNNNWSENAINWNNAPAPTDEIAHLITSKVTEFKWDCTSFIKSKITNKGKISIMIAGQAGGNETDDLISKENALNNPPRLITVFSSGVSNLAMGVNSGVTVEKGGVVVLTNKMLEMKGATHSDIIYKLESAPSSGWLVKGTSILRTGSTFTQEDIDVSNIIYINNGIDTVDDHFSISVSDPDGGEIPSFLFPITVQ